MLVGCMHWWEITYVGVKSGEGGGIISFAVLGILFYDNSPEGINSIKLDFPGIFEIFSLETSFLN